MNQPGPISKISHTWAIPDKTNKSAYWALISSTFFQHKPLKKIGQITKKEYALEETAEDELDLDVNIDGDNQEKSNSENVLNESQNIQENSSSL